MALDDAAVLHAIRPWVSPGATVERHRGGEQARVWRIVGAGGVVWVKAHRHAGAAAREAHALELIAPHLLDRVPTLLGRPRPGVLVLGHVTGRPLAAMSPGPDRTRAMQHLGALLATLRSISDVPDDPLDARAALRRRFERWWSAAAPAIEPELAARVRARFDATAFRGALRVWSHRDVTLDNVLVDDDGRVGLVDFGQARPDVWPTDLAKPFADPRVLPAERDALARAAGLETRTHDDATKLRSLVLLHGVATIGWGVRHGSPAHLADGGAILHLAAGA